MMASVRLSMALVAFGVGAAIVGARVWVARRKLVKRRDSKVEERE